MPSTNKTTNYNLSQFIGTDKPAWLSDYNSDMSAIDAQMKLNADAATTAAGAATTANTNVGSLSNLTTDAKTNVVAAINEVDGHADSAATTAGSALAGATAANTAITALSSYLNLSVHNQYSGSQFNVTSGSGTLDSGSILYIARNSEGSLCKIYGTMVMTNSTAATRTTLKLNVDTGLRPSEQITLLGTGMIEGTSGQGEISNLFITINTDGTIELEGYHAAADFKYRCLACLIFVSNFGDQPE